MAEPFLGEIRICAFNFAPKGWALCDGQKMAIQQNAALNALIGTYYGGDRTTYFNLPDLRGRTPVGMYTNPSTLNGLSPYNIGASGGTESVTLTTTQMPSHNHLWRVTDAQGDSLAAANNFYATAPAGTNVYTDPASGQTVLHPKSMSDVGGNAAHNNMQPFLTTNFCIALQGIWPARN